MSYIKPENYRNPEFCEGCPVVRDMEQIEVRLSNNNGRGLGLYYSHQMPAEKVLYVHDPKKPEAGAIILGPDYVTDPFCGCHQTATSANLGRTHEKIASCAGPIIVKSWFGLKKKEVCGSGYVDNRKFIDKVNELGQEYKHNIIIPAEPRPLSTEL